MLTTPQPKQPDSWMIPVAIILATIMMCIIGYLLFINPLETILALLIIAIVAYVLVDASQGGEDE